MKFHFINTDIHISSPTDLIKILKFHLHFENLQKEFVSISGSTFHQSIRKRTLRAFCLEIVMTVMFLILFFNTTFKSQISIDFVGSSMELIVFYNFLFYWYTNGIFTRLVMRMFAREMQVCCLFSGKRNCPR